MNKLILKEEPLLLHLLSYLRSENCRTRMKFIFNYRKQNVRRCLEFNWSESSSTSNFMLVSSETLRLRTAHALLGLVISTSRLFTKYSGSSSYEAPHKLISCSGLSCTSIEVPSMRPIREDINVTVQYSKDTSHI